MIEGFFESSDPIKSSKKKMNTKKISGCESCGAYLQCQNGRMGVSGNGDKEILIIHGRVNKREEKEGKQFVDLSGQYLRDQLREINIDIERDCWSLNAVQCYAEKLTPNMKEGCRTRLDATVRKLKPKKILLLGDLATDLFLQERIQKSRIGSGNIERFMGKAIPDQEYDCWVVVDYSPSFIVEALSERRKTLKKFGKFRERTDIKLWDHPQLIKDADYRIRSLYFKKHLRNILIEEEFKSVDYNKACEYINNVQDAISVLRTMKKSKVVAMDFETDRLKPFSQESTILAVSVSDGQFSYSFKFYSENRQFMQSFKSLMLDENIHIIIANAQFEENWNRVKAGFSLIENCHWDTVLAAHILNPTVSQNTNLKLNTYLVTGVLGYDAGVEAYIKGEDDKNPYSPNRLKELPIEDLCMYNALDSLFTTKVYFYQKPLIEGNPKLHSIFKLYMRGQVVYADMTFTGMRVDENKLIANEMELEKELTKLEYDMKNAKELDGWKALHPGEEFNFKSNAHLSELFFDILGYGTNKKTNSGAMSIDKDVIQEISKESELAKLLVDYKKIFKLKNTDLQGVRNNTSEGRIHPDFGLSLASTGRSNSSNMNFQNLNVSWKKAVDMIRGVLMGEEGHHIVAPDYSSLEIRGNAGITKDQAIIKELSDPNEDSHTLMTQQFFGEDLDKAARFILENKDGHNEHTDDEVKKFIKDHMRKLIKNGNFCLQYNGSVNRLFITLFEENFKSHHLSWFEHLGYDTKEKQKELCKKVYDYYWDRYKMLKEWGEKTWEEYLTNGYVYSKFGFILNGINSMTFLLNAPIQGASFVMCLMALIKLWERMKEKGYQSKIIVNIHDSIEISTDLIEFYEGGLKEDIEDCLVTYINRKVRWLELPLAIDFDYFKDNWANEAEEEEMYKLYEEMVA